MSNTIEKSFPNMNILNHEGVDVSLTFDKGVLNKIIQALNILSKGKADFPYIASFAVVGDEDNIYDFEAQKPNGDMKEVYLECSTFSCTLSDTSLTISLELGYSSVHFDIDKGDEVEEWSCAESFKIDFPLEELQPSSEELVKNLLMSIGGLKSRHYKLLMEAAEKSEFSGLQLGVSAQSAAHTNLVWLTNQIASDLGDFYCKELVSNVRRALNE